MKMVRLGDVLTKLTDGTHKTPQYTATGVPFLSVKDMSDGHLSFTDTKFVSPETHQEIYKRCDPEYGDILLTKIGTTGIPVLVDTHKQFSLFVSVALLKYDKTICVGNYLVCALRSEAVQAQCKEKTQGNGNQNWVLQDIANTIIPLPSLDEQKRLAVHIESRLSVIDRLRDLAERQLAAARQLRSAYLCEMFDACEWEHVKLGDVCHADLQIVEKSSLPYLGLEMIKSDSGIIDWNLNTAEGISNCYLFDSRHILYGKLRPYLNKVALPDCVGRCSTEITPLLVDINTDRDYVAYYLRRKETADYAMLNTTGSRMPRVDIDYMMKLKIPYPPLLEQRRISEQIKSSTEETEKLVTQLTRQLDIINAMPAAIMREVFGGIQ